MKVGLLLVFFLNTTWGFTQMEVEEYRVHSNFHKDIPTKYLGQSRNNHIFLYKSVENAYRIVELDSNFIPTGKSKFLSTSGENYELILIRKAGDEIRMLYKTISASISKYYLSAIDSENFRTLYARYVTSSAYGQGPYDFLNGMYPDWNDDYESSYLFVSDVKDYSIEIKAISLGSDLELLLYDSITVNADLGFIPAYLNQFTRKWNKPIGENRNLFDMRLDFESRSMTVWKYSDRNVRSSLKIDLPIVSYEVIDNYWWKVGNTIWVLTEYGENEPGGKLKGVCLCSLNVATEKHNCSKMDLSDSFVRNYVERLVWNKSYANKMLSKGFITTHKFHSHYQDSNGFTYVVASDLSVSRNLLVFGIHPSGQISWINAIKGSNRETIFHKEYHSFNDFYYAGSEHGGRSLFFYNGNQEEDDGSLRYKRAFTISPNETIGSLLINERGDSEKRVLKDFGGNSDYLYWENSTFKLSSNEYLLLLVGKKNLQEQYFMKVRVE